MNGKTRYGGYKHLGWDDTASWLTIAFMFVYFTGAGIWAFYN
jgi:hypothetical protein